MTKKAFSDKDLGYLRSQPLGRLATARPDGTLQNSPVGFGYNDGLGTIDVGGHNMAASHKFKNVAAGSSAAFVVDDVVSVDPWQVRCLEIRGRAEAITDPGDSKAQTGGAIIRIHPEHIVSFGIESPAP